MVHPTDEYSSSDAHHQPHFTQAEDLEHSIREMFIEYKQLFYRPDNHTYNPNDKDANIYKIYVFIILMNESVTNLFIQNFVILLYAESHIQIRILFFEISNKFNWRTWTLKERALRSWLP